MVLVGLLALHEQLSLRGAADCAWRLLGTALSFLSFSVGAVILAITVFPILNIFISDRGIREDIAQRMIHRAFRVFVRSMVLFRVIDFNSVDDVKLQEDNGVLIVSNHPSLIDVVLIISLIPRAQCIVKHQIWRNPFLRGVVTAANYIRNDGDPDKLVADCQAELAKGKNLIVFPEGSRTVPGQSRRLHRGFAHIAIRTGAAIRLATVECVPPTLLKGQKWYDIPPRRPRFTVRIHERINVAAYSLDAAPSIAVRRLTHDIKMRWGTLLSDD